MPFICTSEKKNSSCLLANSIDVKGFSRVDQTHLRCLSPLFFFSYGCLDSEGTLALNIRRMAEKPGRGAARLGFLLGESVFRRWKHTPGSKLRGPAGASRGAKGEIGIIGRSSHEFYSLRNELNVLQRVLCDFLATLTVTDISHTSVSFTFN